MRENFSFLVGFLILMNENSFFQATRLVYFNHTGEFIFPHDIQSCPNGYFTLGYCLFVVYEKAIMNFMIRNYLVHKVLNRYTIHPCVHCIVHLCIFWLVDIWMECMIETEMT
jgi:hypothetical protein